MIRGRKGIFQRGLGMTKKDEVFDYMVMCAQKCGTEDKVFNTQELAEELQMQRSNLSTLLNDLGKRSIWSTTNIPPLAF